MDLWRGQEWGEEGTTKFMAVFSSFPSSVCGVCSDVPSFIPDISNLCVSVP